MLVKTKEIQNYEKTMITLNKKFKILNLSLNFFTSFDFAPFF